MRTLLSTLTALMLSVTPVVAQDEMTPAERALYEAALTEGELTWYISQYSTTVAENFGRTFTERYPGVNVNVIRATGQVIFSRLMQDIRSGAAMADVFSGTDLSHLFQLKADGQLAQFVPETAAGLADIFQNLDPEGYFHTTSINPTVMVYNTNLVSEADAPTNWTDLIDPRWRNQVAVAHPGFSGSAGSWALLMVNLYGDDFFERLEAQNPQIGRSNTDPPAVVGTGERLIGSASMATSVRLINAGSPMRIVYPTDGVKLTLGGSAVMANAPHPNAARLFMHFLQSDAAARLMVTPDVGLQAHRPGIAPPPNAASVLDMVIADLPEEEVLERVPEIIEAWRDVFGG